VTDAWPYLVLIVATLIGALFVVPWMAERIARRDYPDGWMHEHTDRERRDPNWGRARDKRKGKP
jgi:hypothetical protein